MLKITIPKAEYFDESNMEFVSIKEHNLQLEHSLVSISKWEARWHKPFLSKDTKTREETLDYIRCMTLTQNVDPLVYANISRDIMERIYEYIENPMTATVIRSSSRGGSTTRITTNEEIYQAMIALGIPFECQKWHLNRLLTLIKVCEIRNSPPKKMSKAETMRQNQALNKAHRKKHHSRG